MRTEAASEPVMVPRTSLACVVSPSASSKPSPGRKVAETLRLLNRNIRLVFDWLLMTENFRRTSPRATPSPQPRRPGPPHFGKGGTSEQICPAAA
jgi:hypothetical protein